MKHVAFYTPTLTFRGSCLAIRNYAHYNEVLLGNRSILLFDERRNDHEALAFQWLCRRFQLIGVSGATLDAVLERERCDVLYCIKYGTRDEIVSTRAKTVIHCVFTVSEPHGDVYAAITPEIPMKEGVVPLPPIVPHIVDFHAQKGGSLRERLGIPATAVVFGRHGGMDTFNVEFARQVISGVAKTHSHIYFVLVNTPKWDLHPQIVHMDPFVDTDTKHAFIRTCDAMIVPERLGHTFGYAIAEFCAYRKPIVCYNGADLWNRFHIHQLQSIGLFFENAVQLHRILVDMPPSPPPVAFNPYEQYSPERVMCQFDAVFLQKTKI